MSEEIELQKKKDFFIEKQIMDNSISAAFRARGGKKGECSIYFDDAVEDEDKEKIRRSLSELIKEYAESYKKNEITPEKHIDNIKSITAKLTDLYKDKAILKDNVFRVGITQKAFNLYLKYLWCLGLRWIEHEPPHCPFDRIVIGKLGGGLTAWTKVNDIEKYKSLVEAANKKRKEGKEVSLAQFELTIFNDWMQKEEEKWLKKMVSRKN